MILGCYNFVSALEYERLKKDLREENRDKVYQGPPPPPPPIEIPPLSLAGALSGAFLLVGGGGGDGGPGGAKILSQGKDFMEHRVVPHKEPEDLLAI